MGKFFGSVNNSIKLLTFISTSVNMADGFIAPIFAIFITQKIAPGEIAVVGYAIAIYWFVKSVLQLPLAKFLDKTDGERDDYQAMLIGGALFVLAPLLYMLIQNIFQLYLLQVFLAVCASLYVVPWASIFTRHVDRFRIGFEWSLNSSALGFGLMAATALGGYLAQNFGYNYVFILASIFNFIAFIGMVLLSTHIKKQTRVEQVFPEQHPHK